jgi:hypothetical protein
MGSAAIAKTSLTDKGTVTDLGHGYTLLYELLLAHRRLEPLASCEISLCCKVPVAIWRGHPFDRTCHEHDIEHRLARPNHPWANSQVEQMDRTLKAPAVSRYHYDTHRQLEDHLAAFLGTCNFARRLKTLRGLTLYESV